jgi:hypothetical protein
MYICNIMLMLEPNYRNCVGNSGKDTQVAHTAYICSTTEVEPIPSLIFAYCEIQQESPPAPPQEGSAYEDTKWDGRYIQGFEEKGGRLLGHEGGRFSRHLTTANSERIEMGLIGVGW